VAQVAAVNAERLTNLAAYNAQDEAFHLLKQLRNLSQAPLIIQTEGASDEQLPTVGAKDYAVIYQQELVWRKNLQYPPFADYCQFFSPKNASQQTAAAEKLYQKLAQDKNLQVFTPTIINAPFERWEITFKKPRNYFLTRPTEAADWPLYLYR
jgi:primosomal protein N'